jgi:hypothetical protein
VATYQEKIAIAEAEILQLQNRAKEYKQKLKAQERAERTRRICQRGGYIEKVLPDTILLTGENFQNLIDAALCTNFAQNKLTELLTEQERQSASEAVNAETQTGANDIVKPPEAKRATD